MIWSLRGLSAKAGGCKPAEAPADFFQEHSARVSVQFYPWLAMIRYRAACLEIDLELNHLPMGHEVGAGPFFPSFMVDAFPYFKAGDICFIVP